MSGWIDLALIAVAALALFLFLALRKGRDPMDESGTGTGATARARFRIRGYLPRIVRQAGFQPKVFLPLFLLVTVVLAVLFPLALVELAAVRLTDVPRWGILLAALLGLVLPTAWLDARRRDRQRRIWWSLSYFLDLIVAFLRSGLGLEESFRRAGREGFRLDHPLAQEVALVARELDLGKERAAAFHALAERTGVVGLRSVAAALESGLRLGASVEATLRAQAELFRARRREDTLKRVQLAAVKALVPVILCGVPLFVVIVFFPAVTEILRTFSMFVE
jgi:tight adherence protein C